MNGVTAALVRERFHYDPDTGVFTWRTLVCRGGRSVGDVAGSKDSKGYWRLRINGCQYAGHRVAWLYVTGIWPTLQIDHINGCRADNRWANLREANAWQNAANTKLSAVNRTGVKGVSWQPCGRKWRATIRVRGQYLHLGSFAEFDDAVRAREMASRLHFGEFARDELPSDRVGA